MRRALFMLMLAGAWSVALSQAGSVDMLFNPVDSGFGHADQLRGSHVWTGALVPGGKMIIAGLIQAYDGVQRNRIARLLNNGRIDTTFRSGFSTYGMLYDVVRQPDDKLLVCGNFDEYSNSPAVRIARLIPNGDLDTSFYAVPFSSTNSNWAIVSLALQQNGAVLIGGTFQTIQGLPRAGIARIHANGFIDPTFDPGTGVTGGIGGQAGISDVVVQPDGRILIAGNFQFVNGTPRVCLARLLSDGSLDTTFATGSGFSGGSGGNTSVRCIALRPDGRIIITGNFTQFNGMTRNRIARLMPNGDLDTTFHSGSGPYPFGNSGPVTLLPDQSMILSGTLTSYNGHPCHLARIMDDGSADTTFAPMGGPDLWSSCTLFSPNGALYALGNFDLYDHIGRSGVARITLDGILDQGYAALGTGANGQVQCLARAPNGSILAGGGFTSYGSVPRNGLVRFDQAGSLDTGFDPTILDLLAPGAIAVQPDGRLLFAGYWRTYDNPPEQVLRRYLTDGTLDPNFTPLIASGLSKLLLLPDSSVIIAGSFLNVNGVPSKRVARVLTDGTLDLAYAPTASASGFNSQPYALALQQDGKVLVGGTFSTYMGQSAPLVTRLLPNGAKDQSFTPGTSFNAGVLAIAVQSDGKILVGGAFNVMTATGNAKLVRLMVNGALDIGFDAASTEDLRVNAISVLPNGKIIVAGASSDPDSADLVVLLPDGSPDPMFVSGHTDGGVYSILTDSLPMVYVAGSFTEYNSIGRNRIARLVLCEVGAPCDDGNSVTMNDVWTSSCTCAGDISTSTSAGMRSPILRIWPNPAHDVLNLSMPVTGRVFDAWGRVVLDVDRSNAIPLGQLAPGVYLLRVEDGGMVRFVRE